MLLYVVVPYKQNAFQYITKILGKHLEGHLEEFGVTVQAIPQHFRPT